MEILRFNTAFDNFNLPSNSIFLIMNQHAKFSSSESRLHNKREKLLASLLAALRRNAEFGFFAKCDDSFADGD